MSVVPKIVDREQRRRELAAIAGQVLVAEGLEGFTTRRVTEAAGVSKGVLSHYFDGKADLMISVLEHFYDRIQQRVNAATEGLSGLDFVRAAMLEVLPLDEDRLHEAVAEMSFAAASVSDPAIRRWYATERRRVLRELTAELEVATRDGDLAAGVVPSEAADDLLALMDSLSLQAVAGATVSPTVQRARLARALNSVLAHSTG